MKRASNLLYSGIALATACLSLTLMGADANRLFVTTRLETPPPEYIAFSNTHSNAWRVRATNTLVALVHPDYRKEAERIAYTLPLRYEIKGMEFYETPAEVVRVLKSSPRFAEFGLVGSRVLWCEVYLARPGEELKQATGVHVVGNTNGVQIIAPWIANHIVDPDEALRLLGTKADF